MHSVEITHICIYDYTLTHKYTHTHSSDDHKETRLHDWELTG